MKNYLYLKGQFQCGMPIQAYVDFEYNAFRNKVWLDTGSDFSGTDFPVGSEYRPVNNIKDALRILEIRGFSLIEVINKCECGGSIAKTPHSDWCPKYNI